MKRMPLIFLSWVALFALVLIACSAEEEPFGDTLGEGSGGQDVGSSIVTQEWTNANDEVIGAFEYDSDYFITTSSNDFYPVILYNCTPSEDLVLSNCDTGNEDAPIQMRFSRITGLAETSCRFQAATLARDDDYDIGDFGNVDNNIELSFHRVDIDKDDSNISFYCAELKRNTGVMIEVESTSSGFLESQQVFQILNTFQKR